MVEQRALTSCERRDISFPVPEEGKKVSEYSEKLQQKLKVLKAKQGKPNTIESLLEELQSGVDKFGGKLSKARRVRNRRLLSKLRQDAK